MSDTQRSNAPRGPLGDFKPATYPYDPAGDARRLPAAAASLAPILAGTEPNALNAAYADLDLRALRAQARFNGLLKWEVRAALAATLIGATLLSPLGEHIAGAAKWAALGAQYLALALATILGLLTSHGSALLAWRDARYDAERKRTGLFRAIVADHGPEPLPFQLAYVVKGLLDDQLGYFRNKVAEHGAFLAGNARWRLVAYLALLVIFVLSALSLALILDGQGVALPPWLMTLAKAAAPLDQPRILMALGVIAAMLQNVATLRAQLSLASRNIERYQIMTTRLTRLKEDELPAAEAAARRGDHQATLAFAERLCADLDEEAIAWAVIRGCVVPARKWSWRRRAPKGAGEA